MPKCTISDLRKKAFSKEQSNLNRAIRLCHNFNLSIKNTESDKLSEFNEFYLEKSANLSVVEFLS